MSKLELRASMQSLNISHPYKLKEPTPNQVTQTKSPQIEVPKPINGFFMLANHVFSEPLLRSLTGDTFKVFLWMSMQAYRFRQSDGTVRASAKFVSVGVGIAESSVTRSFDALIKNKLIKRIEINYKTGNKWWVSPIAFGGSDEQLSTQNEVIQNEPSLIELPKTEGEATPNIQSNSPKLGEEPPQIEGQINKINNLKINNSFLTNYFLNLKPERKKESELECLVSLKRDYSEQQIGEALESLLSQKDAINKYHSPLAYLSKAMEQVLGEVTQIKNKQSKYLEMQKQKADEQAKIEEENNEWHEKEEEFLRRYPTQQDQERVIREHTKGLSFGFQSERIKRAYVINRIKDFEENPNL